MEETGSRIDPLEQTKKTDRHRECLEETGSRSLEQTKTKKPERFKKIATKPPTEAPLAPGLAQDSIA